MNISNWFYADHSITILQKYGYYAIFLDNEFYCSCDNWKEVKEELGLDFSNETFTEYDSGCDGKDCYKMYFVNKDVDIKEMKIQDF